MDKPFEYKFTVFTSTFNRGSLLVDVFDSLKNQTFKDFEWIIVDDGSTDNTENMVSVWLSEGKIPIRYFKQQNQGKHVAINLGVEKASGELFLIIDSDDTCERDALEKFLFYWNDISTPERENFSGVFFNCTDKKSGKLIGTAFPAKILDSNLLEVCYRLNVMGDKWGFFRTDILRKFPFPVVSGEKFISEAVVWNRISLLFKARFVNEGVLIVDYRKDGLSLNSFRFRAENPKGAILYYREFLNLPVPFFWKVRGALNYVRFLILVGLKLIKEKI